MRRFGNITRYRRQTRQQLYITSRDKKMILQNAHCLLTGYGHIAPVTRLGRAVSMGYAFIGIPLLLMVLADLGKLFTRFIKNIFKYARKIFFAKRLKKVRQAGRRATIVPQVSAMQLHNLSHVLMACDPLSIR